VASWLSQNVNNPTNHAYSATGNLYITDPAGAKVHVIDSTGQLVYSFGKTGSTLNAGEFTQPYGIAIISNDLYITDRTNNYIVRFRTANW
jgi:DNA-binding beta-propeller fold protein YncE